MPFWPIFFCDTLDKHSLSSGLTLESRLVVRIICHKACDNSGVFARRGSPGVKCRADVWFGYEGL